MTKFGLDFGTTNSSISLNTDGRVALLNIDQNAPDPSVIRSALYFFPRKLVISNKVTQEQIASNTFMASQIHYEGEVKNLIGAEAITQYLQDNKNKTSGVRRKVYTGRKHELITWTNPYSGRVYKEWFPEFYEEVDFVTGRLLHALKTALKSPLYKRTTIYGDFYSLENLIAILIREIKERAENLAGQEIKEITCGRPVHFSDDGKKDELASNRLAEALKLAGFERTNFEYEPIGAAKYFLSKRKTKKEKILVFDFGGGTLDTAIVEFDNGFKVLATDGVYIGGNLLNSRIFQAKLGDYFGKIITYGDSQLPMPKHFNESLNSWFAIPNLNNPEDMNFLRSGARYHNTDLAALDRLVYLIEMNLGFEIYEAIEIAKKELSEKPASNIIYKDGPIDIDVSITKTEFEEIINDDVLKIKQTVLTTLEKAELEPEQISVVVRTGGSSLIPAVEQMLVSIFGTSKVQLFDTFTSIAAGLSL